MDDLPQTHVNRVDDFQFEGDGAAPAWQQADWLTLTPINGSCLYQSRCKILYSATGIYCLFDCEDIKLTCTDLKDNDYIFNEDVVEAFFWPEASQHLYLEYELSPLGIELPLIVPNANGKFCGWIPWNARDERAIRRATHIRSGEKRPGAHVSGWTAEFFIPFDLMLGFQNVPPKPGTRWRANFCRIDYDQSPRTLFSWSAALKETFHEFTKFGTLIFT